MCLRRRARATTGGEGDLRPSAWSGGGAYAKYVAKKGGIDLKCAAIPEDMVNWRWNSPVDVCNAIDQLEETCKDNSKAFSRNMEKLRKKQGCSKSK